jgi:hypothetical protein
MITDPALLMDCDGLASDAMNVVKATSGQMGLYRFWSKIQKSQTYEEYFRSSYGSIVAEEITKASNPAKVKEFNRLVGEINECIGDGVTTHNQVYKLGDLVDSMWDLMRGAD